MCPYFTTTRLSISIALKLSPVMLRLFMLPLLAILSLAVAGKSDSGATVYLIRHGEKPANGGQGLSPAGKQRAQCLRNVFGASSSYNIGYIIAEQPEDS